VSLKIVCSGHLIRYPVGGFTAHHLQYLLGFQQLGHQVVYFEDFGWPQSCYDFAANTMTDDPSYGLQYWNTLLGQLGVRLPWCFLSADGQCFGMSRDRLDQACRECDIYFNLSNINWIPELWGCRRRVLIDTDPVFTQIRAHGLGGSFDRYHSLFTYALNIINPDCTVPDAGESWLPTRQPVALDIWPGSSAPKHGRFTTLMNWTAYGEHQHEGRTFGQKDREFDAYFDFPARVGETLELAVRVPQDVRQRMERGGWHIADPRGPSQSLTHFRDYVQNSAAEFALAKHGYVITRSGWFSDRSACYLALGRPVILQDTGFSSALPCGLGLLTFANPDEATAAVRTVRVDYEAHCRAARSIAREHLDSRIVLTDLLDKSFATHFKKPAYKGVV
jgi:hypothetical protein